MDVRLHEHEADRLASLRSYHVLDSAPDEAFDMLTRLAARVCDAPISMISLVDQDRQWFLSRHGVESTEDPRSESVCSDVVVAGAALVIPDLSRTPRYADLGAVVGEPGYRAYAGTPLVGRDGLALGTLCVIDTEARDFDAGQLGALDDLAVQVVAAMELRRYDAREGLMAPAMVPEARQPVTLRRALDNHEFVPFYQPIVDMRSGAVVGFEALVRWQHPTRGLLTPDAFLPGLETGTLALWTTRAVLEAACQLRVDLRPRGLMLPEGVAVNLSGRQLANPGLAAQVLAALARHGLPGTDLTLEITESAGLTDIGLARQELLTLRAAGVRIVADDFGVGWSNLTRLLQLPLTGLKIDQELVTGMVGDRVREHMVSSAIALAATMGLSVVAEGVESEAVRDRLLALGCRRGQGWLFSRALPAADLAATLTWQQEHRQVALCPQPGRFERVPVTGLAALPPDGPAAPSLADAVLDALPDSTAVLDADGVVVAVNRAWRMFTVDNDGRSDATGVGVSYLDVCATAMAAGCPEAAGVLEGLRAVLAGETVQYDSEYPCSSPEVRRWFLLRMMPLGGPAGGAVLSHVDITRRKVAEDLLAHEATHDPLTSLPNRALFFKRLTADLAPGADRRHNPETADRTGSDSAHMADVAVFYIDLEHFKSINDTFGHAAGDEVLQSVAWRLRGMLPERATIGRLGGDEFAITLAGMSSTEMAELTTRLNDRLAAAYRVHGEQVQVRASIGAHLATAGDPPADALRRADLSMYGVKVARQASMPDTDRPGRSPEPVGARPGLPRQRGSELSSRRRPPRGR